MTKDDETGVNLGQKCVRIGARNVPSEGNRNMKSKAAGGSLAKSSLAVVWGACGGAAAGQQGPNGRRKGQCNTVNNR